MDSSHDISPETELPSCSSCRKRKLKCSRQTPTCSNCERLGAPCVYENRRTKPGLKGGAVESLNQRLEKVEKAIFGQTHDQGTQGSGAKTSDNPSDRERGNDSAPLETVLSLLAGELQKLNKNIEPCRKRRYEYDPFSKVARPTKRQLQEIFGEQQQFVDQHADQQGARSTSVRRFNITQDHLENLLEAYFDNIQPWLSMLPIKDFSDGVQNDPKEDMIIVLDAMTVAALRYVEIDSKPLDNYFVNSETIRLGKSVMLDAMGGLSIQNLQALVMLAFTEIGNGNLEKAWPIIGSLTRTVEYMGLSVESNVDQRKAGLLPDNSLSSQPQGWKKEEEQRQLFWNVFILDRISSIIKGWNPGIDSAHIRRRLPMCGGNWFYNEPAITPYFGNWDQPAARSDHNTSPCYSAESNPGPLQGSETTSRANQHSDKATGDISKIGSLAYYIQSIDSLSQILTTFLQPAVDFTNRQQVSLWLTKFKELDLRLVHWKMYLPQQWKDSGISREFMPGVMDPSMAIANATHNTSLILLHERIAYPDVELLGLNLPTLFSAETCCNAAVETANITTKYLGGSPVARPVSPQFGICAYVSARVLLVHSRYYKTPLVKEFAVLLDNLTDMSNRWAGHEHSKQTKKNPNFFDQLFDRLQSLHHDLHGIISSQVTPVLGSGFEVEGPVPRSILNSSTVYHDLHASVSTGIPANVKNLAGGMQGQLQLNNQQWHVNSQSSPTDSRDELFTISQTLMDNEFLDLDRIVSFEDMNQMMTAGSLSQYYGANS
ncbi:hypothetical protein FBEOM_12133 [Fusarium beomiforme]|uniref:Zn(2)-C6 fungal-type domain-containing protein n=1 Tax=Fusarium beomiforme TaxID=44412 RepID=A0A9P5A850_9HYPO|nr:hypothetical protein FBEOM_12133 [Fusarium beomiforme]